MGSGVLFLYSEGVSAPLRTTANHSEPIRTSPRQPKSPRIGAERSRVFFYTAIGSRVFFIGRGRVRPTPHHSEPPRTTPTLPQNRPNRPEPLPIGAQGRAHHSRLERQVVRMTLGASGGSPAPLRSAATKSAALRKTASQPEPHSIEAKGSRVFFVGRLAVEFFL